MVKSSSYYLPFTIYLFAVTLICLTAEYNMPERSRSKRAWLSLQLKLLAVLRHFHVPTKTLFDVLGHCRGRPFLTMSQKSFTRRRILQRREPAQDFLPVGVGREAADALDVAAHGNPLAENLDLFLAVQNSPARCASRLV